MKLILQLLFLASVANAKYLRRLQEKKLFYFFPAADYVSVSEGVVPEPSTEGTDNLSQLKAGNFIHYTIELPVEASYLLQVRLASPDGGGSFDIANADTGDVYATFDDLPASGNWQRFKHINRFVTLPAGTYTLSVNVKEAGFNLLWLYLKQQDATLAPIVAPSTVPPASPPIATPVATPAAPTPTLSMAPVLVPVAPVVTEPVNPPAMAPMTPTEYKPDEVEKWALMIDAADFTTMQGVEVQTVAEGNRIVAFLDPGDFIEYMVDFPLPGKYRVSMSVASPDGEGSASIIIGAQEVVPFTDVMPVTSAWTSFETTTVQIDVMTTGLQPLRLNILEAGWNLLWLYFYHDMAHDCTPTPAPSVLKESSTHDCDDEKVPVVVVPDPTPEPTSAPTDCHNSTESHNSTMEMGV